MLCPVDRSELFAASVGGYQIHRCAQCMGASINGSLLRDIRAHAALAMHRGQSDETIARTCSTDGTPMRMLAYKGIAINVCPKCFALWLEGNQLPALLELAGAPKHMDLSKIEQSLPTLRNGVVAGDVDGLGEIFKLSVDVINAIGKLTD